MFHSQRTVLLTIVSISLRVCLKLLKQSGQIMKKPELEQNGEMTVGEGEVESQIHEFSFAVFHKFYSQML